MIKVLLIVLLAISSYANDIETSGTVISNNEKVITSRHFGYIKKVFVQEGSFVKKNQLLYKIDSSELDSLKNEAKANLTILENKLDNVKLNYNRYKRLYKDDLIAKYDLEQLELNLLNLKNLVSIAKAKLTQINNEYNYLNVKASNDSMVIKKSIKEGEMAMPGAIALVLTDLQNLKIKTSINESDLVNIKKFQKVEVSFPSINFNTIGKIDAIIPSIDNTAHSFIVKISFDKKEQIIYPGMYAKLTIKTNRTKDEK
ncbi:efflux RND transporter periplasmic adaptor subunit [Malaciobacter canalis]|jgi:RND family efflux transporter MFP subunit|uniref:Efflux RND transporter periplasmic adaptor subunit n=1 Tax=Malaciobacter canalis TaxID=1912871 RepID=A0ABX4LSZ9_9BACT|nr:MULTISPECIES: efflux RND transporter periplasmic adaptor subunit [Malaciobacter]PHO11060.1 efflux RND transporter periplasmic adaptor subunit [Malaciobacter canalis]QEE33139.1 RND family efflux system, membrane fusion protein [Malaciobacter canalis]SKB37294.1 RND family efflux transporter, MFP subunit [Malaciobacter marinus]